MNKATDFLRVRVPLGSFTFVCHLTILVRLALDFHTDFHYDAMDLYRKRQKKRRAREKKWTENQWFIDVMVVKRKSQVMSNWFLAQIYLGKWFFAESLSPLIGMIGHSWKIILFSIYLQSQVSFLYIMIKFKYQIPVQNPGQLLYYEN